MFAGAVRSVRLVACKATKMTAWHEMPTQLSSSIGEAHAGFVA